MQSKTEWWGNTRGNSTSSRRDSAASEEDWSSGGLTKWAHILVSPWPTGYLPASWAIYPACLAWWIEMVVLEFTALLQSHQWIKGTAVGNKMRLVGIQ